MNDFDWLSSLDAEASKPKTGAGVKIPEPQAPQPAAPVEVAPLPDTKPIEKKVIRPFRPGGASNFKPKANPVGSWEEELFLVKVEGMETKTYKPMLRITFQNAEGDYRSIYTAFSFDGAIEIAAANLNKLGLNLSEGDLVQMKNFFNKVFVSGSVSMLKEMIEQVSQSVFAVNWNDETESYMRTYSAVMFKNDGDYDQIHTWKAK